MDQNVVDLCAKFYRRSNLGFKKYGCTTKRTDLTEKEWLIHLQEERLANRRALLLRPSALSDVLCGKR